MKKIIITLLILFALKSQSQQVQWASKLIKYSSDLGGKQNGIKRILGKPDAFPQVGSSPNAWSPKNAIGGRQVVEVGFEKTQTIKQVAVFENIISGSVFRVSVADQSGKYQTVWSRPNNWKTKRFRYTFAADRKYYFGRKRRKIDKAPETIDPGVETIILESPFSNAVSVKVEFDFSLLPGEKQIDAIGISDSEVPIEATINTKPEFQNLKIAKTEDFNGLEVTNPCVSKDEKKLFLTAINTGEKEQIYSFTKDANGNWSNKQLESSLNTGTNYNHVENIENDFILKGGTSYSKGTTETGFEIFSNTNGTYSSQGQVKITAYNNYDDTADASMSSDGKIIIMGIETDFTQGGSDLYFAQKKDDGTFGLLQNMGKVINSAADEGMPQLLSDNKTLLFSSNGFSSYGDFDIFITYRLDDTWKNWSEPINLGDKINTNDFDGLPFYNEATETLFYISSIDGKQTLKSITVAKPLLMTK